MVFQIVLQLGFLLISAVNKDWALTFLDQVRHGIDCDLLRLVKLGPHLSLSLLEGQLGVEDVLSKEPGE